MPPDPAFPRPVGARPWLHRRWWPVAAVLLGSVVLGACDILAVLPSNGTVAKGQFVIQCKTPVRSAPDDPIVFPNQPGAAHLHEFYANKSINASSTYQSLLGQATGCASTEPFDTASYWHPTLYANGTRLAATSTSFYYTNRTRKTNATIKAHPAGLKMIAGSATATAPQGTNFVYWGCGDGSPISKVASPPQCRAGTSDVFTLHVIFPDCWNGTTLDSADHKAHMAYSVKGSDGAYRCPTTHPISVPTLIMRVRWKQHFPAPASLTLSSGSVDTMHADFWNAWDQGRLDQLTAFCVTGGRDCDEADRQALPYP